MRNIQVTDIQKTSTGVILFLNGTTISASITEAQDVTSSDEGIVISPTSNPADKICFSAENIKSIGTRTYTPLGQNSNYTRSIVKGRQRLVFFDLVKDLMKSCCSTLNLLTAPSIINPTTISMISTEMVGFYASGELLFACSNKSLVTQEDNYVIIGSVRVNLDIIDTVLTTSYTPLQENTNDRRRREKRFNDVLTQLLNEVFKSSCETATAGATVNIDLRELNVTTSADRINDWAPAGWPNSSDLVKVINITSTTANGVMMISGLTNGAPGRIVTLKNKSADNLIILEKNNPASALANRMSFQGRGGYFLFPDQTVTLLHDGTNWTQLAGSPTNGHALFDDFIAGAFSTTVQALWLPSGFAQSAGTGSLVRNQNANLPDNSFGTTAFITGTTATAECSLRTQPRSGSESFYRTGSNYAQACMIVRLEMASIPTSLQDYQLIVGLNESALVANQSLVGFNGWKCQFSTGANWTTYASNNTGSLISEVVSVVPVNLNTLILGVYCPTNVGDFVYIYSLDSINYNVERRFTRVSGTYGGTPHIGIRKLVGTTSVTLQLDYQALTVNKGVV